MVDKREVDTIVDGKIVFKPLPKPKRVKKEAE